MSGSATNRLRYFFFCASFPAMSNGVCCGTIKNRAYIELIIITVRHYLIKNSLHPTMFLQWPMRCRYRQMPILPILNNRQTPTVPNHLKLEFIPINSIIDSSLFLSSGLYTSNINKIQIHTILLWNVTIH